MSNLRIATTIIDEGVSATILLSDHRIAYGPLDDLTITEHSLIEFSRGSVPIVKARELTLSGSVSGESAKIIHVLALTDVPIVIETHRALWRAQAIAKPERPLNNFATFILDSDQFFEGYNPDLRNQTFLDAAAGDKEAYDRYEDSLKMLADNFGEVFPRAARNFKAETNESDVNKPRRPHYKSRIHD